MTSDNIQFQETEKETIVVTRDVTRLLQAWCEGNSTALDELMPLVEQELYKLAHQYMRREAPGHVLQTRALVNEVYLRLVRVTPQGFEGRTEFYALSARLMRNILVDFARRGRAPQTSLDEALTLLRERPPDLVALDDALRALAAFDQRKSLVVELRYFGGLSEEEIAETLQLSLSTVKREWKAARTWLYRELRKGTE